MAEKWRDIPGYKGHYQVSSYGRVKSLERTTNGKVGFRTVPEIILKPGKNEFGYLYVILCKNGTGKPHRVNRLVGKAFKRNPLKKKEVNHIDGDRANNRADNLEWTTRKENLAHVIKLNRIGRQLKLAI